MCVRACAYLCACVRVRVCVLTDVLYEPVPASEPVFWSLLQQAREQIDGLFAEDFFGKLRLPLDHGLVQVAIHFALERLRAAQHAVQHHAVAENVGSGTVQLVLDHLGSSLRENSGPQHIRTK